MQIADIPANETERLKALHSLEIMDTEAEERFDRLTRLAAHLFKVPISLVSFVDANHQWFKSCVGLDVSETEREVSFCAHAILKDELFIIEDASQDPRFADNPLVINPPYIRLYIGRTLKSPDGHHLGTLCIIDDKPRKISVDELAILEDLAKMAENELVCTQLALLDELTQISNRRGFVTLAEKSLHFCRRNKLQASLITFDLDKFKPINDHFGHAEGDRVLRSFAKVLTHTFRDSDVIARVGGDEFALLLTASNPEATEMMIQRFHNDIAELNQTEHRGYDIEFSYGVYHINDLSTPITHLLKRADAQMYKYKFSRK